MRHLCIAFTCSLVCLGCASGADDDGEDGVDDGFVGGSADAFGVADGSPDALGTLLVANRGTAAELQAAGVASNAVAGIVGARPFATLGDLDDVPYVGPVAYTKLHAAAAGRGWTTPSFYSRTDDKWASYTLIARRDGTLTALVRSFTNEVSLIVDVGTGLQKRAKLSDGGLLPASTSWVEDRSGHLFAAIVPPGSSSMWLVRITPAALHQDGLLEPALEKLLDTSAAASEVATAIGDDGTVYLAYARSSYASGIYVRGCAPGQPCGAEEKIATPSFPTSVPIAIAVDGTDVVVALGIGPTTSRVFRGRPGQWTSEALPALPSPLRRFVLATGRGRVVLAVQSSVSSSQTATFFERVNAAWTPLAVPANLIADGSLGLQILRAHDLAIWTARRLHRKAPDSHGILQPVEVIVSRVLRQGDGFLGQDVAAQNWLGSSMLATGEIAYVDPIQYGAYVTYRRTRGQPVRWRDALVGAGSLEAGRDPCLFSPAPGDVNLPSNVVTDPNSGITTLTIPAGTTTTFAAGSCIHLDRIAGAGTLVLAGTDARPIHLLGTSLTVTTIRATYAFFDDTPLDLVHADYTSAFESFGHDGQLDHVSVSRAKNVLRATEVPAGWSVDGTIYNLKDGFPTPRHLVVNHADFGPIAGDALSMLPSTNLEIHDSRFHDITGTAIALVNGGLDDARLTIDNTKLTNVTAGIRLLSITETKRIAELAILRDNYLATYQAVIARIGAAPTALSTPIQITNVSISGPTTPPPATERAQPGILLQSATGSIEMTSVTGSASDGVRLSDPGIFEIGGGRYADNARHGIAIIATAPRGLGTCFVPPPSMPPPSPPVYPDPAVLDSVVENNAGAGIFVSGPHIPMTVSRDHVRNNKLAGFTIDRGRAISPQVPDPSCGPGGWRREEEVDVPLSAQTALTGNDFVGNGAGESGLELRSDHRTGTLPIQNNYWGVAPATVASKLQCTGACAYDPARSTPIP